MSTKMFDKGNDFLNHAGINAKLLKMCGVIKLESTILSNGLAIFSFLCLTLYSVTYTFIFVQFISNLEAATAYLSLVMSFVGGQSRFSLLLWSRTKIMTMLDKCDNLWSNLTVPEKQTIHIFLKKSSLITYIYLNFCAFTILSYAVAFILQPQALDENNQTLARKLPYAFLGQVTRTPYYEMTYALQMISVVNVGFTCVACDTTGMFLIMIACGHLTIIQQRFLQFKPSVTNNKISEKCCNREMQLQIISTNIVYHQSILKYCEDIEKLANIIFFTGLVGTTYNLSIMGFKLTSDDPAKLTYAFQTAILVMQLFVYNWPPDLLINHSAQISRAVWYSPWHKLHTESRKLLTFVIRRANRPVQLTAGKLFYLSLENFASMISAAASFFTVLSTVK